MLNERSEVLGVLHIKDIYLEEPGPYFFTRLARWLHQPVRVDEESPLPQLLQKFQEGQSHFALALDRDDQPSGFLTLEDVLETIFGEITDEHERLRRNRRQREPRREGEGRWLARGETPLFRLERLLGRGLEGSDEVTTLSGLLMRQLDRVPQTGDRVEHDGLGLEVLKMRGPRVEQVRVSVLNQPAREEAIPAARE